MICIGLLVVVLVVVLVVELVDVGAVTVALVDDDFVDDLPPPPCWCDETGRDGCPYCRGPFYGRGGR